MFKKILVPVDGSEGSWRALDTAVELGKKFGGELHVINVIQPYNNAALLAVPLDHATVSQGNSELEKIGDKVLEMASSHDKKCLEMAQERLRTYEGETKFSLEVGHPSERIIAMAKKTGADAIIIGSRGLSGIAEFFLGSVSSKVAQYANVPVLIVK